MNETNPDRNLTAARAFIARALLPVDRRVGMSLGSITLHEYQRHCAERLLAALERDGGVMLADPVGVGKTYIALAVANAFTSVITVIPAALRDMWAEACSRAGTTLPVITHEALSRGTGASRSANLVVIDEAHRLRSTDARRYAAAAELCRGARVLLVTATPIHNSTADLRAQLALFLGTRAWTCDEDELATFVVRDARSHVSSGLPRLEGPHLLELPPDDDLLDDILALPSAVPATDEGAAETLVRFGLVHQWSSSRAALRAALERRRARGLALLAGFEAGRHPARAELQAWSHADGALQLAFPELVTAPPPDADWDPVPFISTVSHHLDALQRLGARVRADADVDHARARLLVDVRDRHPGERIIAFSQYAETIGMLYRELGRSPGVAMLTARGARIASGRLPRAEVLEQFTQHARSPDPAPPGDTTRIGLLLTTDLLSEGLNLQRASVVVHLDLPWNPARLDQRVGRVRRLGSMHQRVSVYTLSPPAAANRLLDVERRLRNKLLQAEATVGVVGRILPCAFASNAPRQRPAAERLSASRQLLSGWQSVDAPAARGSRPLGGVWSDVSGLLALARVDGEPMLVADVGHGLSSDLATVERALRVAGGRAAPVGDAAVRDAEARVTEWLNARRGRSMVDLSAAATARARRAALARVSRALARTPRHRLPLIAPLAHVARTVAVAAMSAGAERVLETLVKAELPDEAWLRAVAAFGEVNVTLPVDAPALAGILALVLFVPS